MRQTSALAAAAAVLVSGAAAQSCISLAGSTTCSAFNQSSFSTSSRLVGFFPFLSGVANVGDFDRNLAAYVNRAYVATKYTTLFGCSNVNVDNSSNYYARYTASFICNGIVQNSLQECGGTARPLCADACAELALSEEAIVSSDEFCTGRKTNYAEQLRADFTNCALPANSLSINCISGASNEPQNCGFGSNLVGLCNYCRASTLNDTDSCCFTSDTPDRCQNVQLPVFSSIANLIPSTTGAGGPSSTGGSNAPNGQAGGGRLSGGAIAGIVIGSLVGAALVIAALIFACITLRRRRSASPSSSMLNQPSPQRKGGTAVSAASYPPPSSSQQGYEVLPGGRVARMTAMQSNDQTEQHRGTPVVNEKGAAIAGAMKTSPEPHRISPDSNEYSSPDGVASGQSEQLPFFKDYYSNDDIHPNDKVSVLWAYQPRAGDEFELERGDMLKVVGIWDDGWATGVRIDDRAEDYEGKHKLQRDSGMSSGERESSPPPPGEIKAFPLVCVCLPEAWKKTVEGDSSTESGSAPIIP